MAEIVILAPQDSSHAIPLKAHFGDRCVIDTEWVPSTVKRHQPDLVITVDERFSKRGLCIAEMARQGVATLQVMDGILEWRNTWAYPTTQATRSLNQPALAHKIACLGRADARLLEHWGNVGKCEIVGSPRFDHLVALKKTIRTDAIKNRPLRLLVVTAKTPGFSPEQIEITYRSLEDLRDFLETRKDTEVFWRVTQNLHKRLGVQSTIRDLSGKDLHTILGQVDAVITTPSTVMLEAMLFGHPVALLDYHNCPHYIPAAWRIINRDHLETVLEDLRSPPLARMIYQDYCLQDALACQTPALPRMVTLIEAMLQIKKDLDSGRVPALEFPHRILDDPNDHISWPSEKFDLQQLYPHHPIFGRQEIVQMQAELEAALGTIELLNEQVNILTRRLHLIPGYKIVRNVVHHFKPIS